MCTAAGGSDGVVYCWDLSSGSLGAKPRIVKKIEVSLRTKKTVVAFNSIPSWSTVVACEWTTCSSCCKVEPNVQPHLQLASYQHPAHFPLLLPACTAARGRRGQLTLLLPLARRSARQSRPGGRHQPLRDLGPVQRCMWRAVSDPCQEGSGWSGGWSRWLQGSV